MELKATLPLHEHRCSFWTLIRILKQAKFQILLLVSFGHILVVPKAALTRSDFVEFDLSNQFLLQIYRLECELLHGQI